MRQLLRTLTLVLFAATGWTQTRGEWEAGLKSSVASERAAALVGIGSLKKPDLALLEIVAASLLDDAEEVRVTAAYSLAGVAGKVGCKLDQLMECRLLAGVLESMPKVSQTVPPRYPNEAKEQRVEGKVRMELLIDTNGMVQRLRVLNGPDLLREPAATAVRQWRYSPAKRDGKAVPFAMVSVVTFQLK